MKPKQSRQLPPVEADTDAATARFEAVGVDEQGRTLYHRLDDLDDINAAELASSSDKFKKVYKKPVPSLEVRVKDYEDMTPSLRQLRHEQTKNYYPEIDDLLEDEFILTVVDRHSLGKVLLWVIDIIVVAIISLVWLLFLNSSDAYQLLPGSVEQAKPILILIMIVVDLLLLLAGWIGVGIYKANRLFITSERVIQFVANGPFDRKRQTIDLSGIEDISSIQKGMLATLIGYGTVRLSTIGDETTYTLTLVENPDAIVRRLNAILQAVKNDRPVPSNN